MTPLKQTACILLAGGILFACATDQKPGPVEQAQTQAAPQEATKPKEPVYTATPGLSQRARLRKVIRLLEVGNAPQAEAELSVYMQETPNSRIARNLLTQIKTPMSEYFPADNFSVKMEAGDSLSTLAKAYLGDALKFYALSRYNEIDNPSQVSTGREIKIPATKMAREVREAARRKLAKPTPAPESIAAIAPAAGPIAKPKNTQIKPASVPRPAPQPKPKGINALSGWAKVNALTARKNHKAAAAELEIMGMDASTARAKKSASIYLAGARQLNRADAARASQYSLRAGELYLETLNDPDRALEALELSTSLDPSNEEAEELLTRAQAQAIDNHYRAGLEAYRRQNLDKAIANWDRVLKIDPEHTNASLYRTQAIKLKQRLSKM